MGKGQKKSKSKPDGTFLVVVDPWGTHGNPSFINNVAAWFEVMLSDDHPGVTVDVIYTQKQHKNIILEFRELFDPTPFLGAHQHARFLSPPHNITNAISYVYEYDYENYKDPSRRGWAPGIQTYESIPNAFPIKLPYPIPTPAPPPPSFVAYALKPKVTSNTISGPSELPASYLDTTQKGLAHEKSSTNESAIITRPHDQQPTTLIKVKNEAEDRDSALRVKKRDPYEEDHEAESLLRPSCDPTHPIKQEDYGHISHLSIKKEEPRAHLPPPRIKEEQKPTVDHAEDFLNSILPVKNEAPLDYSTPPSAEQDPANRENYVPSADLMAAFAGLPADFFSQAPSTLTQNMGSKDVQPPSVKTEHDDDFASRNMSRARSSTLATEVGSSVPPNPRIKPEPQDEKIPPPEYARTRDPRRRAPIKHQSEDSLDDRGSVKRIKSEGD